MIETQHIISIDDLISEHVLVREIFRLGVGGALDDCELDALELFAFDAEAFGDALFGVFEGFAL